MTPTLGTPSADGVRASTEGAPRVARDSVCGPDADNVTVAIRVAPPGGWVGRVLVTAVCAGSAVAVVAILAGLSFPDPSRPGQGFPQWSLRRLRP